jgi:hypothetical protein
MYDRKTRRQAARLGITLPTDGDVVTEDWSSEGEDTLYEGPCTLKRTGSAPRSGDALWTVFLRKSKVAADVPFGVAVGIAQSLTDRKVRRAYRGHAPKARTEVLGPQEQHDLSDDEALKELAKQLSTVNGGNVTVR